eukprot:6177294-Pleurochrysis_carterae.AAC.3
MHARAPTRASTRAHACTRARTHARACALPNKRERSPIQAKRSQPYLQDIAERISRGQRARRRVDVPVYDEPRESEQMSV